MADITHLPTGRGRKTNRDRLPEKGEVVLAFGTRSATTGQYRGVTTKPNYWRWKGNTIKHVSHWMPLPEPPKEGGSEDG